MHAAPVNASTLEWDTSTTAAKIEDNKVVVAAEDESESETKTQGGVGAQGRGSAFGHCCLNDF